MVDVFICFSREHFVSQGIKHFDIFCFVRTKLNSEGQLLFDLKMVGYLCKNRQCDLPFYILLIKKYEKSRKI